MVNPPPLLALLVGVVCIGKLLGLAHGIVNRIQARILEQSRVGSQRGSRKEVEVVPRLDRLLRDMRRHDGSGRLDAQR